VLRSFASVFLFFFNSKIEQSLNFTFHLEISSSSLLVSIHGGFFSIFDHFSQYQTFELKVS